MEDAGRKRHQTACRLTYEGLLGDKVSQLSQKLRKIDFNRDQTNQDPSDSLLTSEKADVPMLDSEPSEGNQLSDDEDHFFRQTRTRVVGLSNMVIKLNKQEEDDLIKDLEMQGQANDTLKELDEALMDRNTAQQSLRHKSQFLSQHAKINSSNFQKTNQEPAALVKKLKLMAQTSNLPGANTTKSKTTGKSDLCFELPQLKSHSSHKKEMLEEAPKEVSKTVLPLTINQNDEIMTE